MMNTNKVQHNIRRCREKRNIEDENLENYPNFRDPLNQGITKYYRVKSESINQSGHNPSRLQNMAHFCHLYAYIVLYGF